MRRGIIGLVVLFSFSLFPAYAATPPKLGTACSKQGITKTYQGKKFTCIKSGTKLLWNKGVVVKKPIPTPTPSPTPTPTPSPTPTQASNPSPSKTLDPKYPRQGQPCLRNSQDVIGYDDTGLLVDLMCNQFDDHYFPRPRDQKPFEVDQITGLRIKPKFNELLDVSNVQFKNITENSWNEALALKTSNYEPPQFFVDPNFNRTTAEGIKSATLEVLKHFTTYINRQIPIYSILSTSKNFENSTIQNNEILSLLANQSNGVIASQDKAYETLKTSSYGSALTFQIFKNNEVVAIGQVYRFNESTTGSFSDFAVGSHETMHAIQYMVIPDLSQVPMWFIEGQATQVGDIFQGTNQTLDDIATVLRASPFPKGSNDLRNFESYAGMDCCGLAYSRGMAANTYLTGKYGWDSMINFMNFVGRDNMDWKLAFQKAFGLSIINFYSDVQDYISWLSSP